MLPKIFIASSGGKGRLIAEAFVKYANDQNNQICKFYPWWEDSVLPPGQNVIDAIVNLCRNKMDYSLIFFTNDSQLTGSVNEPNIKETGSVTKNCFIEWGISVGALGLDRTLSFTFVNPDFFPFDIKHIKHKVFSKPNIEDDWFDKEEEKLDLFIKGNKKLLQNFFESLQSFLDKDKGENFYLRRPLLEVISQDTLLEFEQPTFAGCNGRLKGNSRVEIALREPIESSDLNIAQKIVENCNNNISYHYIYTISEETQNTISNTFCTLLSTLKIRSNNIQAIDKAYTDFIGRLQRRMTLYFNFDSFEFEYCIHNNIVPGTVVYLKLNKSNTVYYTKFYDIDNKVEINTLKTNLLNFKQKFKPPSENSFFVELVDSAENEALSKKYSIFIDNLRNQITEKLRDENYSDKVIECLIQMPSKREKVKL